MRKIIAESSYDCIISVSAPFSSHYIAYKLKKEFRQIKWIAYYFDPFSFNLTEKSTYKKRCRFEDGILHSADGIIITRKIYEEFSTCELKKHLHKSKVCEFPNLVNRSINKIGSAINFDDDKINCVFVGNIYSNIRNPKYFLDLLYHSNEKIKFYLVGNADLNLDDYKVKLNERFEMVGTVPLDEAFKIMNDADVLINIGNDVQNQLPSKIIDYISTGKPIVNTCKHDNCLTLPYMKKYPLSLNIFEKDIISDADVREFENFCRNAKGKKIEFAEIQKLYETSTPKYVSNQIMEFLK